MKALVKLFTKIKNGDSNMEKRELLLALRREGKLKGHKPCFVYLKHNLGKIYNEGSAKFIIHPHMTWH